MADAFLHKLAAQPGSHEANGVDLWQFPDLSLLGDGRRNPPEFPLPLLGDFWANWSVLGAKMASAPLDYVAVSLLTGVSTLIANARWPLAGAGWKEPPILWAALVGSPSSGKSPALDGVLDVLRHAEEKMAGGYEEDFRKSETERAAANARREEWEHAVKTAIKAGEPPPPLPDNAKCPEQIVRPRLRVSDCTTEKLGSLAACHERGLLLVRDELSGWLGAFDKYGGGGADRAFAIEMYGGRSYVIDRVKNSEPLTIPRLSISVVGGIQPDKLPTLVKGPDDGLISRFLWAWPGQNSEFHLAREAPDYNEAKRAFSRLLDLRMGSDEFGKPEPALVKLEPAAESALEEFARQMKRAGMNASGPYAGSVGKARGHVLRLATVIEYLWWCPLPALGEPEKISAKAVLAAAGLMESYFLPMAERVFGDAAIPLAERNAIFVIKHLRKIRRSLFNARDLRREIGGPVRNPLDMDAACVALEETGLIRPIGKGHGRPRKDYEVNPAVSGDAV